MISKKARHIARATHKLRSCVPLGNVLRRISLLRQSEILIGACSRVTHEFGEMG